MNMTLTCQSAHAGSMSYTVNWSDDVARYHVWVSASGTIDDVIHKNSIAEQWIARDASRSFDRYSNCEKNPAYFPHRALDISKKAHAGTLAAIRALVTPEALKAAKDVKIAEEKAAVERAEKASSDKLRAAMAGEIDRLRLEGKAQVAHDLETAFADLSDDQVRRFASILRG